MTTSSPHFKILQDIARDLSGDVNFPTCMDAAILVRNTLRDPYANLTRVVQVIGVEPLISSKLLKLANSVAFNPSGQTVSELSTAINRLGFEAVRTTSLAVAMDQMLKSRNLTAFDDISRNAWEHSLRVAAIARVLARRIGRINPDEAMLAGLVHDIGIFYLLYRATEYPEYRENPSAIIELICGWHEGIGESLLHILGLPDRITDAVRDHDSLQNVENPCSVRDVLYFANLLAGWDADWLPAPVDEQEAAIRAADRDRYADLVAEAEEDIAELRSALSV
ncbi:MAG: HDOD domain-containing protein [Dechloromonas sp.]|uniref:HDOD domain-containing protein n=1 Tax=Candidatus Dechloromonas phosphorivorans TaxID=2899244 RepID=A0A935K0J9_9RHOO|nr:HDOD domain-containing protein [Candidatus Dechloromonas phosphorivorans]